MKKIQDDLLANKVFLSCQLYSVELVKGNGCLSIHHMLTAVIFSGFAISITRDQTPIYLLTVAWSTYNSTDQPKYR